MTWTAVPMGLVVLRMVLTPLLLWDAWDGQVTPWFVGGYIAAVVSDIFDGIIARRLGVSTARLRQADSWADVGLYLVIAISACLTHWDIVIAFRWPLLSVVLAQALWWIVNLAKYGKPASYHTYSAKIWGLTLVAAVVSVFGFHTGGWALSLAIALGLIHTTEEILMTLILPTWHHDVLSLVHAWRLRQPQP